MIRRYVVSAICVALGVAFVWLLTGTPQLAGRPWLFVLGTWLLLVSVVGRLGWKIQTIGGESAAEHLDAAIFVALSGLGTALFLADHFLGLRT